MMAEVNAVPIDPKAVRASPESGPCLIGGKCTTCGRTFFPYREICPSCFMEGKVEEITLDPHGTLVSYTVVRRAPGREVPYAIGYILTPENLMVFAPVVECNFERLRQGTKMEAVFRPKRDREGHMVISYAYRPIFNAKGET
jgi:hypothetical protein